MHINIIDKILNILVLLIPISLILGNGVTNLNIVLLSLFILIILFVKKKLNNFLNNFFIICLIIFNFYLIISSLNSPYIMNSLEHSFFYFRFIFVILSIIYLFESNNNFSKNFFKILFFCYCFLFFDSIFQFIFKVNLIGFEYDGYRLSSFFGDNSILGSYISRLLPLLIGLMMYNNVKNFYLILIIIFSFFVTFLSGERVAVFYVTSFLIYYIFFLSPNIKSKLILVFSSLSIISVLFLFFEKIRYRIISTTLNDLSINLSSFGFSEHLNIFYSLALRLFLDFPFLGAGPKNFRIFCEFEEYNLNIAESCSTHPHNTYIQLLSETGFIGFLFIFSLFLFISYLFIKSHFNNEDKILKKYINFQKCILFGCLISLYPLVPTGNFFNSWLSTIYYLPFAFLFVSNNIIQQGRKNGKIIKQ